MLTIVGEGMTKRMPSGCTKRFYDCVCECGTEKAVSVGCIVSGRARSCGCYRRNMVTAKNSLPPFQGNYNRMVNQSKLRNVSVELTFEEYLAFTKIQECHYCEQAINWKPRAMTSYNLDRKDSTIGYTVDNCVVCCRRCNWGKGDKFSYAEWVSMTRTLRSNALFNDADGFGSWCESMWFSKDPTDQEMGERDLAIMGLGIAGEAGEVVEKIKKDIRDHFIDPPAILKELGDVIFYAITIARYYGYKPSDILKANYEKLTSRKERGTERGSGDNR